MYAGVNIKKCFLRFVMMITQRSTFIGRILLAPLSGHRHESRQLNDNRKAVSSGKSLLTPEVEKKQLIGTLEMVLNIMLIEYQWVGSCFGFGKWNENCKCRQQWQQKSFYSNFIWYITLLPKHRIANQW
jgi:hypothetical protein